MAGSGYYFCSLTITIGDLTAIPFRKVNDLAYLLLYNLCIIIYSQFCSMGSDSVAVYFISAVMPICYA